MSNKDKNILVCSNCLTAACWYGEFMCEKARESTTVIKKVSELIKLNLENSEY